MESLGLPKQIHRYRILSEIGRGSMGRVFLAEDPNIERRLALKVLSPRRPVDRDHEQELRERFLAEARAAGRLHHPGIATVYDADEDPLSGAPYLAMEYVDGLSLHQMLRGGRPLPVVESLRLLAQVAYALDYAHHREVVHRDIKPANLLVPHLQGNPPVAKVVDFGIAKLVSTALTQPGYVVGTPNYMAPEQVRGEIVDGRADLFALGAVLYESLTGRTAFGSQDLANVHYKILSVDPRPPEMHNPEVTAAVRSLVDRSLAKQPEDRFQSGQEMAEALEVAADELTATPRRNAEGSNEGDSSATRRLSYPLSTSRSSTQTAVTDAGSLRDPRLPVAVGGESGSRWWYPVASGAFALVAVLALLALVPEIIELERRTAAEVAERQKPPRRTVPTPPFSAIPFPTSSLRFPAQPPTPFEESRANEIALSGALVDQILLGQALLGQTLQGQTVQGQSVPKPGESSTPPPPPSLPPPTPQLRPVATTPVEVVLRSYLRDAYLSAWIDGRKVLTERMQTGRLRRLWGKEFRFTLPMPTGQHTLELHLSGVSRKLEAQKKIRRHFEPQQPKVLRVRLKGDKLQFDPEVPTS